MTLDDRYRTFHDHPSADTLNDLFAACREHAVRLSSGYPQKYRTTIAQMAVARAWANLASYPRSTQFSSWFHTEARSFVQDVYTVGTEQRAPHQIH